MYSQSIAIVTLKPNQNCKVNIRDDATEKSNIFNELFL